MIFCKVDAASSKKPECEVISNPIYREVIARHLTYQTQFMIPKATWLWQKPWDDHLQSAELQPSADYALLHLYRPGSMMGAAISYDLYVENDVVFRVKNK